jgi:sensor histidine kinase YesM
MKTFKFRLLFYLLIVGSIPLFFAVYVFYGQTVQYGESEIEYNVKNIHQQSLQRINQELRHLDYIAEGVNSDFLIQTYIESNGTDPLVHHNFFKEYIDRIFSIHSGSSNYIKQICLSHNDTGTSICTDFDLLNVDTRPVNRSDWKYQIYNMQSSMKANDFNLNRSNSLEIGLIAPIYSLKTEIVSGFIVVLMDFSELLEDIQASYSIENHMIYDQNGIMIYNSEDPMNSESFSITEELDHNFMKIQDDRIIHVMDWNRFNLSWKSQLELRNERMPPSWNSIRGTLIVFFIVFLTISIMSSIVFTRFFTKPIHSLRLLMKRAELGDLKAYWTSTGTQEMNDLGESYNQMLNRLEDLIKQVKWEESLKKEAEIEALRYQLNPHFIYNTLNTIKWVAKIHKTPQISEVVSSLVRLLQASLGKKGDFITIREEISLIEDYMEIQAFRYGDNVKIEYEIDPISSVCLIPKMLLQPLVENALIHGIEPANKEGLIFIKVWLDRDLLMCQVEDNGKGMPGNVMNSDDLFPNKTSVKERMSGIGLKHIREKIKLYYGPDYKMYIINKETKGTIIRLSLPIHRNEE